MTGTNNGTRLRAKLDGEIAAARGTIEPTADDGNAGGETRGGLPRRTDLGVAVVVPPDRLHATPTQSLVRIVGRGDGRTYLGVVTAGPFAEPDGLRGDSPMLTAVATHGGDYL